MCRNNEVVIKKTTYLISEALVVNKQYCLLSPVVLHIWYDENMKTNTNWFN